MLKLALFALVGSLVAVTGAALAAGTAGNPAAGKKVFAANGCGACHAFKPAGSTGKVGPALTKVRLTADAKRAKQSYAVFIRTSIVKPKAYVAKGYKPIMPSFTKLSTKQLNDLVAFVASG